MTNFTFTATDGKRYRVTGEFAEPADRPFVRPVDWVNRKDNGRIIVDLNEDGEPYSFPAIIVTPVEPVYEVTVRLTEELLKAIQQAQTYDWKTIASAVIRAVDAGNYKEVSE